MVSLVDLKDFSEKMKELEKKYAGNLHSFAETVKNPIVAAIMSAVAQDSYKHSLLYETISKILEGKAPFISQMEMVEIADEIERHIKTEELMIKKVENTLKDVENKAVKFILESILKDERYHHALLKRVHEMIVKRETMDESILWDMVWKDAMFHGTPGG